MISRYDKEEISRIWKDENKFNTYLRAELAILEAIEGDKIPKGTCQKIREVAVINAQRIEEIEAITRHDVIAFCSSITENLDPEVGKYFHFGVTSSDIIDTALTLQIKESLELILPQFKELLVSLKARAVEMKDVMAMGRSHGMYAEPLSFGQKLLGHYNEFSRRYKELLEFYENELTIQFSGAVGNYTILTPEQELQAANTLGVKVEPHSTQVIPRDRIAKLVGINALTGAAIERIAVEIRHLHRSEVNELHEGFAKGQKGSSTMPHKKNPISGENLTGMARMLRSHNLIALDNIVLWHERDISHSSAERFYLPDNFGILFYALGRLKNTVDNLAFHNEVIEDRVNRTATYLSSYYLHHLIQKTDFSRDDLYKVVQEAAFSGGQSNTAEDFHKILMGLMEIKGITLDLPKPDLDEIKRIFTSQVDNVFKRSLKAYPLD
ncbi:MAG: adenylosuccinate lyase [Halobacteriovoraceae bacterium]|jgi:adenylosuccinate lyase|nr:adenylosuccinate lyase [Halobacteriovoraceae bacterium]MBT5094081.1 adenylosuccinate lyase [Halobacteriovoraceae bacterium]